MLGSAIFGGTLRHRLWLGGGALALFLFILAVGNFFIASDRAVTARMIGHDFLAFYTAGHFVRTGQLERVYDLKSVREFQAQVGRREDLEMSGGVAPYWNPPFFAWPFVPLAKLSFLRAVTVWWAFSLLCLAVSLVLLCRMLPAGVGWKNWALVPVLFIISVPCQQALSHAQNTFLSLLVLCVVVTLWRAAARDRDEGRDGGWKPLAAGIAAGLLFYKPQLGAVVALVLWLSLGRRALLGVLITGTALLLITALTMPTLIEPFLFKMPVNLRWMQEEHGYRWERHATFKAFWRFLIQGHGLGATWMSVKVLWGLSWLALASWLVSGMVRVIRAGCRFPGISDLRFQISDLPQPIENRKSKIENPRRRSVASSLDNLISATIVCSPLLMPFYFDYDLLLLAVPAVLTAARRLGGEDATDRWLVRAWIAFFAWTIVGPGLVAILHVHMTVLLLTALAALHIARMGSVSAASTLTGGLGSVATRAEPRPPAEPRAAA